MKSLTRTNIQIHTVKKSEVVLTPKHECLCQTSRSHYGRHFGLCTGIVKLTQSDKQLATGQHAHANTHSDFVTSPPNEIALLRPRLHNVIRHDLQYT